jgi:hypothetical protein
VGSRTFNPSQASQVITAFGATSAGLGAEFHLGAVGLLLTFSGAGFARFSRDGTGVDVLLSVEHQQVGATNTLRLH